MTKRLPIGGQNNEIVIILSGLLVTYGLEKQTLYQSNNYHFYINY